MENDIYFTITKGIFLLFLAVGGNYIAQTFSCKTQKILLENMYAKQAMVLYIIFFAIGFTDETNTSPFEKTQITILVWILFLMFTKMNQLFTMVAFSLFTLAYYIQTYIVYYKNLKEKKYEEEITKLDRVYKTLVSITILTIVIGFMMYFTSQYDDKKQNWSTLKFIFGNVNCDYLKYK